MTLQSINMNDLTIASHIFNVISSQDFLDHNVGGKRNDDWNYWENGYFLDGYH